MREKDIRKQKREKEKEEMEERKTERKIYVAVKGRRATRRKRSPNRPTIDSLPCKIAHSDKENKKKWYENGKERKREN
ncbi:hypothetical protein ALC56_07034 [Trachymyrmex septentrionalis]|uniref:Uncharacterized protein n=1 Tax=Trachymyrmex septentrionalis TaxID=34720 RepID=A0A195FDU1_9HYME|nr:hypothetical protein ALC56_07034 [Trachymyrmex septentrionalis]